jgi:hypothetical protein
MDVSSSAPQVGAAVQVALQKQQLDLMKTQGADVAAMIAAAPPAGSVNSPSQGRHIDALA